MPNAKLSRMVWAAPATMSLLPENPVPPKPCRLERRVRFHGALVFLGIAGFTTRNPVPEIGSAGLSHSVVQASMVWAARVCWVFYFRNWAPPKPCRLEQQLGVLWVCAISNWEAQAHDVICSLSPSRSRLIQIVGTLRVDPQPGNLGRVLPSAWAACSECLMIL